MQPFSYSVSPARIIFGVGMLSNVQAEITRLGCKRALVLSTPFQAKDVQNLSDELGDISVGVFTNATMHTPVDITQQAMHAYDAVNADCVVAYGGGSTIGLGKAIAHRNDAPQIVVATTYAGSEVTPILGQTENGVKTTIRGDEILPEVVIYDPNLTVGLPVAMSVASGLNAMAHAVEALYAKDRNPISDLMAIEGIRALKKALPVIVKDPTNLGARSEALYGSWLCGTVLGAVGMSLHHKLCHTLGGHYDTPHAQTHAILLPHTAAYNAQAAQEALKPVADIFGGNLEMGLYEFSASLGAPLALKDIGLPVDALDSLADLASQNPYWNPREVTRDGIFRLLTQAYDGNPPVDCDPVNFDKE